MLQPNRKVQLRFDGMSIIIGLVSAAGLYLISGWEGMCPPLFSPLQSIRSAGFTVSAKARRYGQSPCCLAVVTGPGEELYWRGYLQENLMRRFGKGKGWFLATGIYSLVHIWSFNFMLIGAAAVAGIFWEAFTGCSVIWRRSSFRIPYGAALFSPSFR